MLGIVGVVKADVGFTEVFVASGVGFGQSVFGWAFCSSFWLCRSWMSNSKGWKAFSPLCSRCKGDLEEVGVVDVRARVAGVCVVFRVPAPFSPAA